MTPYSSGWKCFTKVVQKFCRSELATTESKISFSNEPPDQASACAQEQQRESIALKKQETLFIDSDETFPFIAGDTSDGAVYGTRWEELGENLTAMQSRSLPKGHTSMIPEARENMKERFVSELLIPIPEEMDITSAALGEPASPWKFKWRGETLEIAKIIRKWKSTSPCTHGSGERYVRRHWYEIATVNGRYLRIYFERQARSRRERKKRWWVFSEIENSISNQCSNTKKNHG